MRQLLWFGLTGAAAATTHLLLVLWLVEGAGLAPLRANVAGFGLAFLVSYSGHRHFTFAGCGSPHHQALPRFLMVALAGLLLNQGLFAVLLSLTPLPYPLALVLVLAVVAALTFVLGRHWAFSQSQ